MQLHDGPHGVQEQQQVGQRRLGLDPGKRFQRPSSFLFVPGGVVVFLNPENLALSQVGHLPDVDLQVLTESNRVLEGVVEDLVEGSHEHEVRHQRPHAQPLVGAGHHEHFEADAQEQGAHSVNNLLGRVATTSAPMDDSPLRPIAWARLHQVCAASPPLGVHELASLQVILIRRGTQVPSVASQFQNRLRMGHVLWHRPPRRILGQDATRGRGERKQSTQKPQTRDYMLRSVPRQVRT